MLLQILVTQYKEDEQILKPLLDSISIQQGVHLKDDVGVIIVNDGSDVHLSNDFLAAYPFDIQYIIEPENRGVAGARNVALHAAKAQYVMFCDADDMFLDNLGIQLIFEYVKKGGFDGLITKFVEESENPLTGEKRYIVRPIDSTYIHGKIYRRKYLLENDIEYSNGLRVHEDSYFNSLAQRLSKNVKVCNKPIYLWKWRDDSVCRHDPKYILKTYPNLVESNDALVASFLKRGMVKEATHFVVYLTFNTYFTVHTKPWNTPFNVQYRETTEKRFGEYFKKYGKLFLNAPEEEKKKLAASLKKRLIPKDDCKLSPFGEWLKHLVEPS